MAAESKVQDSRVGINVENPKLFSYNGRWYEFSASIYNTSETSLKESLDNQHIEKFEYVNQINQLCLTGVLIYRDIDGTISKFFNRNYNHVNVTCVQKIKKSVSGGNGKTIEKFEDIARPDGATTFSHSFIVEDFGIVGRDKNNPRIITYELKLISANWFKAAAKIEFSNYDLPPGDELKNVFKMIEKFLTDAQLKADTASFQHAYDVTKSIEVDYITNGNDDLRTVMPYLFNRLYFIDEFKKLNRFFYMVYDVLEDTYKIVDYMDETTWLNAAKTAIVLSLFETSYEQSLFSETNQLGSTKNKTQTDVFTGFFDHEYWKYDRTDGTFGVKDGSPTADLVSLYNEKSETFAEVDGPTKQKYEENLLPESFVVTNHYFHRMQDTNNDYRIYLKLVESWLSRDALIVNCEGDITHQPGVAMGIVLDRTIEEVGGIIPTKDLEELYKKHRQIENIFPVFKVRHTYKLSTPAAYTANVIMARNFLLTPKQIGLAASFLNEVGKAIRQSKSVVQTFRGVVSAIGNVFAPRR